MTQTHFGFKQVDAKQKSSLVRQVFSSVASKYDVMNDFMSAGLHRLWKDKMVGELKFIAGQNYQIIDVAGGTGDVAFRILEKARRNNVQIEIEVADINAEMLAVGKDRAIDKNLLINKSSWIAAKALPSCNDDIKDCGENHKHHHYKEGNTRCGNPESKFNLNFNCCDGEKLPYADNVFDYYTIAFGIRNFTNIQNGLSEAFRVLKPGGKFICLEFSQVNNLPLAKIYDFYSFKAIPKIGKIVVNDEASYQYLVESIRKFPNQENFKKMIEKVGFKNVVYTSLNFGVVAIHMGWKL